MEPTDVIGTELSAQTASLRRLARDIVRDPHLAEDVVQDAMYAAIAQPPRARGALIAWLRTVVRRGALDLRRSLRRRRQREQLAGSPADATPDTHEELELMQRVLAAVRALAEPYRTTVWQRYYGDLSPLEIAERQGVPLKTVKVRLWRALGQLRQYLDHHYHGRRAWLVLLGPLAPSQPVSLVGAFLMSVKTKLAIVGVLCVALVLSIPLWRPSTPAPATPDPTELTTAHPAPVPPSTVLPANPATQRMAAPAADVPPTPIPATVPVAPTVALGGVVLDLDARPVSGVLVVSTAQSFEPMRTDIEGRFRGARSLGMVALRVDDPRYIGVLEPHLFDHDTEHAELTIVVALRADIAGVVVDEAGQPIDLAAVTVSLGLEIRPRIDRVLDRCVDVAYETWTHDGGTLVIAAPLCPTARMHIEARGHQSLDLPVEEARHLKQFVLARTTTGDVLEGLVVDEHDQPIAKAVVWLPSWSCVTEPDGTFRIELWKANDLPPGTVPELTAAASGRLQGRLSAHSADWRSRSAWPRDLRIRLGGVAQSISGIVLRHDGVPVDGVHVTFAPPEPEQIRPTMFDANPHFASMISAELAPPKPGVFTTARAVPGSYRLRVFDPQTLDLMLTEPIPTGTTGIELRFPDRGLWPALRGSVVDRRGAPVPGADWIVERDDPFTDAKASIESAWQHANAEGRIEHPPLSRDVRTLCVKAAGMAEWHRFPLADLAHRDFVVPVGCQARVEVGSAWGSIDRVGFVDVAGHHSPVVFTHGNVAWGTHDIPIRDGRSEFFVALDDCVELRLFRGDVEVGRVPVELRPGERQVLRP